MEAVGHEKVFIELLKRLRNADIEELATRKALETRADGKIVIESLGKSYLVGRNGVAFVDGRPVQPKQGLAVASYLLSTGAGDPAGDFVPLSRLGGFNIGRDSHELRNLRIPLLARFGDDYASLVGAVDRVGGIEEKAVGAGQHSWLFRLFPKLLVKLVFSEPDEDFPADVHVLFDARALEFFGFECLGFLPDYFTSALFEEARRD